MKQFRNKVAIVTGGASGIGKALCEELSRLGTVVTAADVDLDGAKRTAEAISGAGGRATAVKLDVSDGAAIRKLVNDTAAEYGRLDYMFNNAGVAVLGESHGVDIEDWRRIVDINVLGVIYGTTAAYEIMLEQGFGHIVNTASQAGLYVICGSTPYAMSKHAVVGLSTSLRIEAVDLGVKVSVICPGPIKSNIFDAATIAHASNDEFFGKLPYPPMDVNKAVKAILKGVSRNQAIIVLPFDARIMWWLHRIHPSILEYIGIKGFRYLRKTVFKNPDKSC